MSFKIIVGCYELCDVVIFLSKYKAVIILGISPVFSMANISRL